MDSWFLKPSDGSYWSSFQTKNHLSCYEIWDKLRGDIFFKWHVPDLLWTIVKVSNCIRHILTGTLLKILKMLKLVLQLNTFWFRFMNMLTSRTQMDWYRLECQNANIGGRNHLHYKNWILQSIFAKGAF